MKPNTLIVVCTLALGACASTSTTYVAGESPDAGELATIGQASGTSTGGSVPEPTGRTGGMSATGGGSNTTGGTGTSLTATGVIYSTGGSSMRSSTLNETGGAFSPTGGNAAQSTGVISVCPQGAQGCSCYATGLCAGANKCVNQTCCSVNGDCSNSFGAGGSHSTGGAQSTGGSSAKCSLGSLLCSPREIATYVGDSGVYSTLKFECDLGLGYNPGLFLCCSIQPGSTAGAPVFYGSC